MTQSFCAIFQGSLAAETRQHSWSSSFDFAPMTMKKQIPQNAHLRPRTKNGDNRDIGVSSQPFLLMPWYLLHQEGFDSSQLIPRKTWVNPATARKWHLSRAHPGLLWYYLRHSWADLPTQNAFREQAGRIKGVLPVIRSVHDFLGLEVRTVRLGGVIWDFLDFQLSTLLKRGKSTD